MVAVERTLFFIKPDGVERKLIGQCVQRIEEHGLRVVGAKMVWLTWQQAELHYIEHKDKPHFKALLNSITKGPVMMFVFQGPNAVKIVRSELGPAKDPPKGTIRGDLATSISENVAHAADSRKAAKREIKLHFAETELLDKERASGPSIDE